MKQFAVICKTMTLLFLREFFGVFFALVFPLIMLILFGSIYGNGPVSPGAPVGYMDVSVPAYSVMIIGVTGLMSFPLTLAGYKEKKIYKRFDATPVGKRSILLAQVLVNIVMTFIGFFILLAAGKLLYRIQIQGSVCSVFIAMFFSIAAMFSMGFFFTAVGRDSKITNLLCYLSYFVMIFLSGATMPDQMFPETVKTAAKFLPMTYAVDLMQGVFAGESLAQHGPELWVLGLVSLVLISVGAVCYRRKDWS